MKCSYEDKAISRWCSQVLGRPSAVVLVNNEFPMPRWGVAIELADGNPGWVALEESPSSILGPLGLFETLVRSFPDRKVYIAEPPPNPKRYEVMQEQSIRGLLWVGGNAELFETLGSVHCKVTIPNITLTVFEAQHEKVVLRVDRELFIIRLVNHRMYIKEKCMERLPVNLILGTIDVTAEELFSLTPGSEFSLRERSHTLPISLVVGSTEIATGEIFDGKVKINRIFTQLSTPSVESVS